MKADAELLRDYASEGSEAAFAEFVRRYLDLVYSAALRRAGGNVHWAGDIAQQVFAAAARQAETLARHASVSGWLYTATRNAAHNLMRDELRRKARERAAQADADLLRADGAGDEWERLRPVLDAAMDELNGRDREAVLLRFFEGRALADVGSRLGLSDNAARMRVDRALDKLRGVLARRGLTSTATALGLALANQAVATAPVALAGTITAGAVAGVGAVSVGAGAGWISFMASTKLQLGIAATIVAAGTLGVTAQSRDNASLAAQVAAMSHEQVTLETLRAQNLELARRAGEIDRLRADDQEYARLQAEVNAARARLAQATAAEKAAGAGGPVSSPGEAIMLTPVRQVAPQLPPELRATSGPGEVVVSFIVDTEGRVQNPYAVSATGEVFATAAIAAVKEWQFKPAQRAGRAVNTMMKVPIVFSAQEEGALPPPPAPGERSWPWF